jgi:hypothetical protein
VTTRYGQLDARGCTFSGTGGEQLVTAHSNSVIANCEFRPGPNTACMFLGGEGLIVRGCSFLGGQGPRFAALLFSCGLMEGNVFAGSRSIGEDVELEHFEVNGTSCLTTIKHNRFLANETTDMVTGVGGIVVTDVAGTVLIDSNLFDNCQAHSIPLALGMANAILVYNWGTTITHNVFTNMPANGIAAIRRFCPARPMIRDNWFVHTNYALKSHFEDAAGTDTLDISENFWGDSTGPYHALYNPTGRGDTVVGNFVRISPWLTDTLSGDTNIAVHEPATFAPKDVELEVSPNPFNSTALISYSVPRAGEVKVSIFDITGRLVCVLEDRMEEAGEHRVTWNAEGMASGIYFAKLQTAGQSVTRKMVLLR